MGRATEKYRIPSLEIDDEEISNKTEK